MRTKYFFIILLFTVWSANGIAQVGDIISTHNQDTQVSNSDTKDPDDQKPKKKKFKAGLKIGTDMSPVTFDLNKIKNQFVENYQAGLMFQYGPSGYCACQRIVCNKYSLGKEISEPGKNRTECTKVLNLFLSDKATKHVVLC